MHNLLGRRCRYASDTVSCVGDCAVTLNAYHDENASGSLLNVHMDKYNAAACSKNPC
jgi:hypothetical protein